MIVVQLDVGAWGILSDLWEEHVQVDWDWGHRIVFQEYWVMTERLPRAGTRPQWYSAIVYDIDAACTVLDEEVIPNVKGKKGRKMAKWFRDYLRGLSKHEAYTRRYCNDKDRSGFKAELVRDIMRREGR